MAGRSPPSPTSSRVATEEGGPDYVEPAARVAVFDNDGTLWTEKPLVIQLDFTIRRFRSWPRTTRRYEPSSPTKRRTKVT